MGILEALTATIAGLGGMVTLIVAVLILWLLVVLFSLPMKLLWNGIMGAIMLWVINLGSGLLGFPQININIIKALIAGIFGIPGAIAVVFWEFVMK